jgi:PhzF family phenazine biosynthesis protein
MTVPLFWVDAFCDHPFSGNPAAVCLLDAPREDAWMQALAGELGLSETAYVQPEGDAFGLRWFTPTMEMSLCGHATLAAAHVLWETRCLSSDVPARFPTLGGLLECQLHGDWIEMDFPAEPVQPFDLLPDLLGGLPEEIVWTGRSRLDFVAELKDEEAVRSMIPDLEAIRKLDARALIVTAAASTKGLDFVVRCFAPQSGIPEDPATGSAQCTLAPYWSKRLGKSELVSYQASARGAILRAQPRGLRVAISGRAVTVFGGELTEPLTDARASA